MNRHGLFKKIQYEPHAGQQEFHNSPARFRMACCGRRYGKSTMAARDLEPHLFDPDKLFWIVGPTYDLGEKEFRVIWDDLMRTLGLGRDKRIKKAFNKKQGTMYIELPWNTRVEVRSADHPENLVGESLDGVIMAEAAKHRHDTWERFVRPALADKRGFATFCTTPEGMNWFYNLWSYGQDPTLPEYDSWRMPSWENTAVFPLGRQDPEILMIENTTSEAWFNQEYGAEFTAFVGKIYSEWDDLLHVVDYDYNPNWPNYLFIDWGFVNALVFLDVQISPSDDIYIWRETYVSHKRLEEVIQDYKNYTQPPGHHIKYGYADAADPEAIATVNFKLGPCIGLPEAKENWRDGIEWVKKFLKPRPTGLLDEYGVPILRPKLFVDRSCRSTIREFNNYRMKKPSRSGLDPVEGPEKKDDHAMDAIRYGIMHHFALGADSHLDQVMTVEDINAAKKSSNLPRDYDLAGVGDIGEGLFTRDMEF